MASEPSKAEKVKSLFDKALADGDEARAEGLATAAKIFQPDIEFKKRRTDSAGVDFAQAAEDEEYREFCRLAGVEGY